MRCTGRTSLSQEKKGCGTSLAVVEQVRELIRSLETRSQSQLRNTKGAVVRVCEEPGVCPLCGGWMKVQKTARRTAKTIELGEICFIETIHACAAECTHPSGEIVTRRARALTDRVPPGAVFGFDVLVWVGLRRFLEHRQREEVRKALADEHGVDASEREVDELAHRFLAYLEALHAARSPAIRDVLRADGGWPLHADATGEDGRGTLLVALAGWRRWVLGAWKIPTEREDQILPHLRGICQIFGAPCAIVRDLGRAIIPAAAALVAELGGGVPIFSCHQHFLADVGKDLLAASYDELRCFIRACSLRPRLRTLVRDLGRSLGPELPEVRDAVAEWLQGEARTLPGGTTGRAVVRALGQWVLDYPVESDNLRFPYDRPYLDLVVRTRSVRRAADDFLRRGGVDVAVVRSLRRLARALDPLVDEATVRALVQRLESRATLFDRLRAVLRLDPVPADATTERGGAAVASADLDQIRSELAAFQCQLQQERPARGPAEDQREAIDTVLVHLDRYADTLWGHAIRLPEVAGGGIRLVDRTNNVLEGRFRSTKQGVRRRTGRKNLAWDFENMPASAMLATNLQYPDYVQVLCGSLEELPAAFARLDADRATVRHSQSTGTNQPRAEHTPLPIASAALPREDRRIVRSEQLQACIAAAARSRAPRVTLSGR